MSILAGIFCRKPGLALNPEWKTRLRAAISRYPSEKTAEFEDEAVLLIKSDSGAFGAPALRIDGLSKSVIMLAGEPLLRPEGATNRARDVEILQSALDADDWPILRSGQGVYSAAYYQHATRTLHLVADKLGIRPVYYWCDNHWFIFASAVRILEKLEFVPKAIDLRAVTEMTCFGFPLGDRTPYKGVRALRPAEVISVNSDLRSKVYWRWDEIQPSRQPESELLREAYDRFQTAVDRRLHGDQEVIAFLSGGLDSRCIVAALASKSKLIHTLNFSLSGTQDRVYGAEISRQFGTHHYEDNFFIGDPGLFPRVSEILGRLDEESASTIDHPLLIWSGSGGSVGLGSAYITRTTIDLLRSGELDAAINQFLQEQRLRIVRRLLRPNALKAVSDALQEGIREEIAKLECEDPGQKFYLFLLLNDQHRHLAQFYEEIDRNRFEDVSPFFDSDFLSCVASVPLDLRLLHRFYNKWLMLFPPAVSSTPWQVYPGHEAPPLPQTAGLVSQFDRTLVNEADLCRRADLSKQTASLLRSDRFPKRILRRQYLRFASLATRWRLRDYSYVQEAALMYAKYCNERNS